MNSKKLQGISKTEFGLFLSFVTWSVIMSSKVYFSKNVSKLATFLNSSQLGVLNAESLIGKQIFMLY